jgi:hypothetical protein
VNVYDLIRPRVCAYEYGDKSVIFRSLLEYRWALFFDRLHLEWEYEPTSFALEGGMIYTPDFWVEGAGFVEIKPVWNALLVVEDKLHAFARQSGSDRVFSIHAQHPHFMGSVIEWTADGVRRLLLAEAIDVFCAHPDRAFKAENPSEYEMHVATSSERVREARPSFGMRLDTALKMVRLEWNI